MKVNAVYRIKLEELEASILKHLPRFEADDTEEIREGKSEQLLRVFNILEKLKRDIKKDESAAFKESAS